MQLNRDFLRRALRGAPWLWIETPARAAAAAIAAIVLFTGAAAFEISEPWRRLATAEPKTNADRETRLVASLAWVRATRVDTVILLGGSTAQELTPSDPRVSALLTERCGRPIRFVNGGTSSQTMAESWIIAESVPDDLRALVIVGMNYLRFEEGFAEVANDVRAPLLPLRSSGALERVLSVTGNSPDQTIPSLRGTSWLLSRLDQVTFRRAPQTFETFLAGDQTSPWQGPLNLYVAPSLAPERKAAIVRERTAERLVVFERRHAEAGALWRAFAQRFDGPDSSVMFLALPEDASLRGFSVLAGDGFRREMEALRRAGAHVVDWRASHGLSQSDFYDQQHLLASGRRKIEPRLIDLLAGALPGCDQGLVRTRG